MINLNDLLEIPNNSVLMLVNNTTKRYHITYSRNTLEHLSKFVSKILIRDVPQDLISDLANLELSFKHPNSPWELLKQYTVDTIATYNNLGYRPYYVNYKVPVRYKVEIIEEMIKNNRIIQFSVYLISKRNEYTNIKTFRNYNDAKDFISQHTITSLLELSHNNIQKKNI